MTIRTKLKMMKKDSPSSCPASNNQRVEKLSLKKKKKVRTVPDWVKSLKESEPLDPKKDVRFFGSNFSFCRSLVFCFVLLKKNAGNAASGCWILKEVENGGKLNFLEIDLIFQSGEKKKRQ